MNVTALGYRCSQYFDWTFAPFIVPRHRFGLVSFSGSFVHHIELFLECTSAQNSHLTEMEKLPQPVRDPKNLYTKVRVGGFVIIECGISGTTYVKHRLNSYYLLFSTILFYSFPSLKNI